MHLTLISTGQFPDTHAAAIRQSTLAKGLVNLGHTVNFLLLTPQNWNGKNSINYHGVSFTELKDYRGTNRLLNYYHDFKAIAKAKKIIKQQAQQKQLDAVVIYTIELLPIYFLLKAAHALGIKVFHERTELPYSLGMQTAKQKKILALYQQHLLPNFDGIFLISNKLMEYMKQFNKATKKLVTVVDLNFFKTEKKSPYPFPYIGYCGNISGNKDGVPVLIESFAAITKKFPELKLVLVGSNPFKNGINETLDAIEKFEIKDKVIFAGLVERDMMPVILCNAEILVVAKPDNEQNSGNFPIKIGEYLATGVPIVVTRVGEIPLFVKDGENGYLATPGSAVSFAQKMEEALGNKEKAALTGQNGKQVAIANFDYIQVAGIMADYINTIINKK